MKKRHLDVDFFYPCELRAYLRHRSHGKNPYEKAMERAERKSLRQLGKHVTRQELEDAA